MSKFSVGDRVIWRCGNDAPVRATIAGGKTSDGYDYELVIDEEFITSEMRMLYEISRVLLGQVSPEVALESELELINE